MDKQEREEQRQSFARGNAAIDGPLQTGNMATFTKMTEEIRQLKVENERLKQRLMYEQRRADGKS